AWLDLCWLFSPLRRRLLSSVPQVRFAVRRRESALPGPTGFAGASARPVARRRVFPASPACVVGRGAWRLRSWLFSALRHRPPSSLRLVRFAVLRRDPAPPRPTWLPYAARRRVARRRVFPASPVCVAGRGAWRVRSWPSFALRHWPELRPLLQLVRRRWRHPAPAALRWRQYAVRRPGPPARASRVRRAASRLS